MRRGDRLFSGPNIRRRSIPGVGQIISATGGREAIFTGAWWVEMNGRESATITPGAINTVRAAIGGVPLEGTEKKAAPVLKLPKLMLDAEGRGYICAEITCLPAERWSISKIEMVQVADPNTESGRAGTQPNTAGGALPLEGYRARWPVAMLRERSSGAVEVYQICWFDLQHRVHLRAGGEAARHFFF